MSASRSATSFPGDIVAPRALTYENRGPHRRRPASWPPSAVQPQYDFTSERAITIASAQVSAFESGVRLLDTAFDPATTDVQRGLILERVAGDLSAAVGETVRSLEISRWIPIRTEALRVLDSTERTELRDTEVAVARSRLDEQMAGGLSEAERMLAAELIAPYVVANSSFSAELTQQERDRQAAAVVPVEEQILQGEVIVRGGTKLTEVDAARIAAFGLDDAAPDLAQLAGWLVLSALLVGHAPRLDLAVPQGVLAPQQRPDPDQRPAALRDVRAEAHRRACRAAVRHAAGSDPDPSRGPPRCRGGDRPDGDPGGRRGHRERALARDRDVRLPRRARRRPRDPPR